METKGRNWESLARSVSEFSETYLLELTPSKDSLRELLATLLLKKSVTSIKSIVLLSKEPFISEIKAIRRSQLEALFKLGAIWKKPDYVSYFVDSDVHRREGLWKNISELSRVSKNRMLGIEADDHINERRDQIKQEKQNKNYHQIKSYATAAGLLDLYLTDYAILSESSHHSIKELESHIETDSKGEASTIKYNEGKEELDSQLMASIEIVLKALFAVSKIFDQKLPSKYEEFVEKFNNY